MKIRSILAGALALALSASFAFAQTNQGSSPLTIAKGGTNATTAAAARTNLGLAIGSATQAWDADLDALSALGGTNTIYYRSGAAAWSPVTIGGMLSFAAGALNVGDAELAALAGLTSAADKVPYFTGSGTAAVADFTALARTLVGQATNTLMRSTLGVVIGTDVQAFDADLTALAGLTSANNKCFYWTGTATAATYDCTSFGRSVANAADASALRTLAGAVIGTDVQAFDADLSAVAANSTSGFWARTGAGTGSARTVTGTANEITVTNGDGVSGPPTISVPSAVTNTGKTITGGTYAGIGLSGVTDNQGTLKLSAFVTSTQITAAQNNYTATDGSNTCTTKLTLRISSDASRNITGLSCAQAEGDIRILHNVGAQSIVLTNQDAASTASNRFLFGGDMTLLLDTSVTIRYDGVASRWRAITTPGAGGGGGGVTSATIAAGNGMAVSGTCTITTSGTCTVTLAAAGHLNGLTISNNVTDATNDIDIAVGEAAEDSAAILMKLASAITKRLDAAWAVGSGNGGRMSAAAIADTTYHMWLIQRSDTGVVDVGFDVSATAPTMPTNYDRKRRIGSIVRASGVIRPFRQYGDFFKLLTSINDRNSTAAFTAGVLAVSVPSGIKVMPMFRVTHRQGTVGNTTVSLGDGDSTSPMITVVQTIDAMDIVTGIIEHFFTNTSAQISFEVAIFSGDINTSILQTYGWVDTRGRG